MKSPQWRASPVLRRAQRPTAQHHGPSGPDDVRLFQNMHRLTADDGLSHAHNRPDRQGRRDPFTDYYASQSSHAGRAAFIPASAPAARGLTKAGGRRPKVESLSDNDPTLATACEAAGLRHRAFDQNHLVDSQRVPHALRCIASTSFVGNLYHLNSRRSRRTSTSPRSHFLKHLRAARRAPMRSRTTSTTLPKCRALRQWCAKKNNTTQNRRTTDLSVKRMETSRRSSSGLVDFIDRAHKAAQKKPFFVWFTPALHIWTHLNRNRAGQDPCSRLSRTAWSKVTARSAQAVEELERSGHREHTSSSTPHRTRPDTFLPMPDAARRLSAASEHHWNAVSRAGAGPLARPGQAGARSRDLLRRGLGADDHGRR